MNTAVLFSGGKDSSLALAYALEHTSVKCLIILKSKNAASYMFHTPNIQWAEKQAEAIGLPAIIVETIGEKEKELEDLKRAIQQAMKRYGVKGVVSGAIESVYQASRIQNICNDLKIESFNPLWQKDQIELLNELVEKRFDVVIVGVFGEGLDKLIGRKIDVSFIADIRKLRDKYRINPAGEGGEYESFVLYAPYYKKRLSIKKSHVVSEKEGGKILVIDELN